MHQTRTIGIAFSLSYATACTVMRMRERHDGEDSARPRYATDEEPAPLRLFVVVASHLYAVVAHHEVINDFGEAFWKPLNQNETLVFAGGSFDTTAIIGLALQRLSATVYERVESKVLNDGKAIKYDLGVI